MTPFLMLVIIGFAAFVLSLAYGQIQCELAAKSAPRKEA